MESWFKVTQLDEKTYAISEPGHWEKVNAYLLIGDEKALLIDSGIGDIKAVVDSITTVPVVVVATHIHWDHIGGHHQFETLYVHESEKDWLEKGIPIPLAFIKREIMKAPFTISPPEAFDIETYKIFTGTPTKVLKDKDMIKLGNRTIQVLHTPGHSPGHLCFLDIEKRYLFSGDLIYEGLLYANYPSTDPALFLESVERMSSIGEISRVFPAHHNMDVSPDIIQELKQLLQSVNASGKLIHGTGQFDSDRIQIVF